LILFALASPHNTGKNGALFEAANLALLQLLIFTSLAVVYYCSRGSKLEGMSGLGRRMPVAAAGVMVGFLGMSGVPLFSGFAGKYLILQAAAQEGLGLALAAGAAIGLCMIAYLRYFHRLFMGQDTPGLKILPEPPGATSLIGLMIVITVVVGLWPAPLISWINRALQGAF